MVSSQKARTTALTTMTSGSRVCVSFIVDAGHLRVGEVASLTHTQEPVRIESEGVGAPDVGVVADQLVPNNMVQCENHI